MNRTLRLASATGYENMSAWSDLLDAINVFPVADADTGRNLKISLSPMRTLDPSGHSMGKTLLQAATGNSGNIAAAFFTHFLKADSPDQLAGAAKKGTENARRAVADPLEGTMLTLFDAVSETLDTLGHGWPAAAGNRMVNEMEQAVLSTTATLSSLRSAGVVDAGALGMFVFFEGFFRSLSGTTDRIIPVTHRFSGRLTPRLKTREPEDSGDFCISTTFKPHQRIEEIKKEIHKKSHSVIWIKEGDQLKLHMHTKEETGLKKALSSLGNISAWNQEKIRTRPQALHGLSKKNHSVHVMTDAAGSINRDQADALGITLLDSYLVIHDQTFPETLVAPERLYQAMRNNCAVSTAQASLFERHQTYESVIRRFNHVIYLAVGSVYTGNVDAARKWSEKCDPENRMTLIDTTAASGRLALISLLTARFSEDSTRPEPVRAYANQMIHQCEELIFLDQLKYLAKGGRLSKTKGFFGDLFNTKPIISPRACGAEKVGVVRKQSDQLPFALSYLEQKIFDDKNTMILLEYSDNKAFIDQEILPEIVSRYPNAEIVTTPLSLTSVTHMGPDTWGVAFCPDTSYTEGKETL